MTSCASWPRDFADLTDTAQQALRSEMRSRGLGDPEAAQARLPERCRSRRIDIASLRAPRAGDADAVSVETRIRRPSAPAPELVPDTPDAGDEDAGPHEYTWKTPLCECDTMQEANATSGGVAAGRHRELDRRSETSALLCAREPRLDRIRASSSPPISSSRRAPSPRIPFRRRSSQSRVEVPEFTPPSCPKCGAEDPVLEGVDPVNSWQCEQCGEQWTDSQAPGEARKHPEPGKPAINGKSRPATGQLSPQGE